MYSVKTKLTTSIIHQQIEVIHQATMDAQAIMDGLHASILGHGHLKPQMLQWKTLPAQVTCKGNQKLCSAWGDIAQI